jgi:hypothetical protein
MDIWLLNLLNEKEMTRRVEMDDVPASRHLEPVFVVGGLTYVPHYSKPFTWVGPAGFSYLLSDLLLIRAKATMQNLWPRSWTSKIFPNNNRDLGAAELLECLVIAMKKQRNKK